MSSGQKWLATVILIIFVIAANLWFYGVGIPWYIHDYLGVGR